MIEGRRCQGRSATHQLGFRTERIATFTHRIHIRSGQLKASSTCFNQSMRPKMVYEWDNKREDCFNMYITENKSLEEIIAHFRDDKNFTPRYLASCTLPLTPPSNSCSLRLTLLPRLIHW